MIPALLVHVSSVSGWQLPWGVGAYTNTSYLSFFFISTFLPLSPCSFLLLAPFSFEEVLFLSPLPCIFFYPFFSCSPIYLKISLFPIYLISTWRALSHVCLSIYLSFSYKTNHANTSAPVYDSVLQKISPSSAGSLFTMGRFLCCTNLFDSL